MGTQAQGGKSLARDDSRMKAVLGSVLRQPTFPVLAHNCGQGAGREGRNPAAPTSQARQVQRRVQRSEQNELAVNLGERGGFD